MDSRFSFLSSAQREHVNEIIARRSTALSERLQQTESLSRSDAEEVMRVLSDELTDNLDDDWEPTDYGRTVSALLAQVNAARVNEWP